MKFLQSYTRLSKVIDIRGNDRNENMLIDYEASSYIRIMKLISPPQLQSVSDLETIYCHEGLEIDLIKEINNPFHIRCYLPKQLILKEKKTPSKVVVMLNGMDEIISYDLYDQLGEFFAKNGIAALLLPTPLHLNRRISPIECDGKAIIPTDIAKGKKFGWLFYMSFLKTYSELHYLVEILNNPSKLLSKEVEQKEILDQKFYETYFGGHNSRDIKNRAEICLLGFSLGGIKSLGYFHHDTSFFHSCISINSGPNLHKIRGTQSIGIDKDKWDEVIPNADNYCHNLRKSRPFEWEREIIPKKTESSSKPMTNAEINDKVKDFREACRTVYFGDNSSHLHGTLANFSHKFLSVIGGGDKIISKDQWGEIVPGKHIHQIIVAGVDHQPTKDHKWQDLFPRVENHILQFINSCADTHINHKVIISVLRFLLEDLKVFKALAEEFKIKPDNSYEKTFTNSDLSEICENINQHFGKTEYTSLREKVYLMDKEEALEITYAVKGQYKKRKLIEFVEDRLYEKRSKERKSKYTGEAAKNLFLEFYYLSKAICPNFPEIIETINNAIRKGKNKKKV